MTNSLHAEYLRILNTKEGPSEQSNDECIAEPHNNVIPAHKSTVLSLLGKVSLTSSA